MDMFDSLIKVILRLDVGVPTRSAKVREKSGDNIRGQREPCCHFLSSSGLSIDSRLGRVGVNSLTFFVFSATL